MNKELCLKVLEKMAFIRETEIYLAKQYPRQIIKCPMHLCLGQEFLPAILGSLAQKEDIFLGNYRSHGHYLAKGGDAYALFAELLGRRDGCAGGMGGSMHLIDLDISFYGSSAIVGATVPIAAGLALSLKMRKSPFIVIVFFGDAALEEGVVYESVNFATLHELPILFVCENNGLAIETPLNLRTRSKNLNRHFECFDLPSKKLEGLHCLEMMEEIPSLYERMKKKKGPFLIEVKVARWAAHVGPSFEGPVDSWWQDPKSPKAQACPLARLVCELLDRRWIQWSQIKTLHENIVKEISGLFEKALKSPPPEKKLLTENVFASGLIATLPLNKKMLPIEKRAQGEAPSILESPF